MDLATATPEQLDRLAAACDPATFGRNREDVYDETYRKAGKLDTANFAVKFDPTRCGIVDIIQASIVEEGRRRMAGLGVRAELYKLNVYGMSFVLFFALFIDGVGAIQVKAHSSSRTRIPRDPRICSDHSSSSFIHPMKVANSSYLMVDALW